MADFPKKEPRIKNRIRYCRQAINLKQKDLALLMGAPSSQVSRWEKGKRMPSVYNAIGLAVATHRLVEGVFSDYRQEWQGKIKERETLLNSKENGKAD